MSSLAQLPPALSPKAGEQGERASGSSHTSHNLPFVAHAAPSWRISAVLGCEVPVKPGQGAHVVGLGR